MRKWLKKTGYIFTIVTFGIMSAVTSSALPENNTGTPSDWAKNEIIEAQNMNLLTDELQGSYSNSISREEFSELVVNLYQALSDKEGFVENESPFSDTQNVRVILANHLGIVNGIGDGKFAPDHTATREEVSVMLYRTLHTAKPEYIIPGQHESLFNDRNMISDWAQHAVGYLHKTGVISGVGNNLFHPQGHTSREEAIILIKRMYEMFSNGNYQEIAAADYPTFSRGDTRNTKADKLKALIAQEMGKPYQWGGTGPNSYDCSGLVYTLYGKLGISLPRVSASQATAGTYVSKENLQYGDLVFFARDGKNVHHVGIYVGHGEFVHAPSSGDVVKISTVMSGYYRNTYYTGRRVLSE